VVIIYVWLTVLTVFIVYIFLLVGQVAEVAGVVETVDRNRNSTGYLRMDDKATVSHVPPDLELPSGGQALMTIFSPSCGSCNEIASQLAASEDALSKRVVFVISTGARDERFHKMLSQLEATGRPIFVDDGGEWLRSCGVSSSPSAIVMDVTAIRPHSGVKYDVYTFGSIEGLIALDRQFVELV